MSSRREKESKKIARQDVGKLRENGKRKRRGKVRQEPDRIDLEWGRGVVRK